MSEPAPAVRETREVAPGVTGAVVELGRGLMMALPPAFIGLLLVNVLFLAVLFHFLGKQGELRAAAVNKLLDHCLERKVSYGHPAAFDERPRSPDRSQDERLQPAAVAAAPGP